MAIGRKTGGRKKGTPNKEKDKAVAELARMKRAVKKYDAIREQTGAIIEEAAHAGYFAGPPDAFLCHVYMNAQYPIDTRVRAATNVLPYLKPKLEAVTHLLSSDNNGQNGVNKLELARRVAYLLTSSKQVDQLTDVIDVKPEDTSPSANSVDQTVTPKEDQ